MGIKKGIRLSIPIPLWLWIFHPYSIPTPPSIPFGLSLFSLFLLEAWSKNRKLFFNFSLRTPIKIPKYINVIYSNQCFLSGNMFPLTLFSRLCICTFFFLLGVSIAYATPMMSPMLPPIINDCSVGPTVVGRRPARDRLLPDCLYLRTVLFCGCVWISLPVFVLKKPSRPLLPWSVALNYAGIESFDASFKPGWYDFVFFP